MTVKIKNNGVVSINTNENYIDFDFSSQYIDITITSKSDRNYKSIWDVKREDLMTVVSLILQYDRLKNHPQGQ